MNDLYKLGLHEGLELPKWSAQGGAITIFTLVRRVPGGWIYYKNLGVGKCVSATSTFVPYNEEFKEAKNE